MQQLLQLKNITKLYRNNKGIKNINLSVSEGKIIAVIGKSGAGKTTLLKTIINKIKPQKGEIFYYGEKLNKKFKNIVREIGYVGQENIEALDISVSDLLNYTMSLYDVCYKNEINNYLTQFNINKDALISELSNGELRILAFINAIYHKPRLIVLDEVTNGIDEYNKRLVKEILLRFKANNSTIILTSHDMSFINSISDNVYYLNNGELIELNDKLRKPNYKLVNITTTKYYDYKTFKLNGVSNININNDNISFMFSGDVHQLLKFLNNLSINDITITNPNINDIIEEINK